MKCDPCPAGEYRTSAMDSCALCQDNTYSDEEAISCNDCDPGTVSNSEKTNCDPCPAGEYRTPAMDSCLTFCTAANLTNSLSGEGQHFEGTTVRFKCLAGFGIVGQSLVLCSSDGTWSGGLPRCQIIGRLQIQLI